MLRFNLLLGITVLSLCHLIGIESSPLSVPEVVSDFEDLPILVPNVGAVDSAILKDVGAEKFLSLWKMFVLSGKVVVSNEPWTLFVPVNKGLPVDPSFLLDKDYTREVLLNHVTLDDVIDLTSAAIANHPHYSLADSELIVTTAGGSTFVNGIRLTGDAYQVDNGAVYVIEESIPLSQPEFHQFVPLDGTDGSNPVSGDLISTVNQVDSLVSSNSPSLIVEEVFENTDNSLLDSAKPNSSNASTNQANSGISHSDSSSFAHSESEPTLTPRPTRFDKFRKSSASQNSDQVTTATLQPTSIPSTSATTPSPAKLLPPSPVETPLEEPTEIVLVKTEHININPVNDTPIYEEFGSGPPSFDQNGNELSFADSMIAELQRQNSNGAEFLHHFLDAGLDQFLYQDKNYTVLVPTNDAFYDYYPIDWGFNPFLVENFTKDVLLNHFFEGDIHLQEFDDAVEIQTIEGRIVKVNKNTGGTLLVNGHLMPKETEVEIPGGRLYFIHELLFVDYDRVDRLREEYPHLETAPLLSYPWPSSPFLSHLLQRLQENPSTKLFAHLLRNSDIASLVSSSDENLNRLSYTAFVPTDEGLKKSFKVENLAVLERNAINDFLLEHIIPGYLFEEDFEDGFNLLSLTNKPLPIKMINGDVNIGPAKVLIPQQFVYNLGAIFLIDKPFQEIQVKEPTTILEEKSGDVAVIPVEDTPFQPSQDVEIIITTTEPSTNNLDFEFPSTDQPGVTFEVRTEISFSKQINDGLIIPVSRAVIERAKKKL